VVVVVVVVGFFALCFFAGASFRCFFLLPWSYCFFFSFLLRCVPLLLPVFLVLLVTQLVFLSPSVLLASGAISRISSGTFDEPRLLRRC
jgi:hypothetical protein